MRKNYKNVKCSTCSLRELCIPLTINQVDLHKLDTLVNLRKIVKKGEYLFQQNDEFKSLYAVQNGFFKVSVVNEIGHEKVLGFNMAGELLGLDGFSNNTHQSYAVALDDSIVCVIKSSDITEIANNFHPLQHYLQTVLSNEIVRENNLLMAISNMDSEKKLLVFLLNLSHRYNARQLSNGEFYLKMSREDIGLYIDLNISTISRAFKKLEGRGFIEVSNKHIKIKQYDQIDTYLTNCNH